MKTLITALIFCGTTNLYAQVPIPKALMEAKTAYLVDNGARPGMMENLAKELTKWGRFTLVDSVEASDVTIRFGGFVAFKGWEMTVTNSRDGSPLWSGAQKQSLFTNRVATDLVKTLAFLHDLLAAEVEIVRVLPEGTKVKHAELKCAYTFSA
jgi:hypothetical protein